MSDTEAKLVIVGGGIGGLGCALALRQQGLTAEVFEQADELLEIGAGLSVWPNATRVLKQLGVLDEVLRRSEILGRLILRTWRGQVLSEIETVADFEVPSICIHRADLLSILQAQLPAEGIHLGVKLKSFEQQSDTVVATFSTGRKVEGQALVGADGINSTVRAQLLGAAKPTYRGYWAWRGVARLTTPAEYTNTASESWGPGQRFGIEPLGGGRTFWYATANAPADTLGEPSLWKDELRERFTDWHSPIPELIEATEGAAILKHEVLDRPPVRRWGEGRVTLLGDAAHPTTPNLGQGACMALEDAAVLARCLARGSGEIQARLRQYERRRFRRTEFITRESRRAGQIGQLENSLAVIARSLFLKLMPKFLTAKRHRQYYSFQV
jgi:2-polyprenyl-6-methoxyphenol hydroxylase-like FAD-dependent oxidoreductase